MTRAFIVLPFLVLSAPAMAQNTSAVCAYKLLTQAHEAVTHCGDALDDASEQRYRDLRKTLEQYVVDNARLTAKPPDNPAGELQSFTLMMRLQMQRDTARKVCAGGDYPLIKSTLEGLTSESGSQEILDDIATPKDPYGGSCL